MTNQILIQEFDPDENGSHPVTEMEGTETPLSDGADAPEADSSGSANVRIIGKVASPPKRESTSDQFHFWVRRGELVEKTQIVRTESQIGNDTIQFYAIVDEVYRQSRKKDIGEEFDAFDGDVNYEPEFAPEGVSNFLNLYGEHSARALNARQQNWHSTKR